MDTTNDSGKTCREEKQDVNITLDEISAEKQSQDNQVATDAEVKAAVEQTNPDEGTLDRG